MASKTIKGRAGDVVAVEADETVRQRVARDAAFRRGLLCEAMDTFAAGELGTAKLLLRDYITGAIGYDALSTRTGIPSKSLIRMFSPTGNPRADNLFTVVQALQQAEGIRLQTTAQRTRKAS